MLATQAVVVAIILHPMAIVIVVAADRHQVAAVLVAGNMLSDD